MKMDKLENFTNENSMNSTNQKFNKRRSSIFKRQSIIPKNQDFENTYNTEEISQESKKLKLCKENELKYFNITKYIESLKEEDKKWREVYSKRKSRIQDLLKVEKNQEQIGQTLNITALTDSERAFLALKPDYEEFNRNLFQLHAMATKVTFLNSCAERFYENSNSKLKHDTDNAVYRIMNLTD